MEDLVESLEDDMMDNGGPLAIPYGLIREWPLLLLLL
jgi:hypothetical protein